MLTLVVALFSQIDKVQIMFDPHSRESRGFGFVTMTTAEEADAAIDALNNTELQGKVMRVEKVRTPFRPLRSPGHHLADAPRPSPRPAADAPARRRPAATSARPARTSLPAARPRAPTATTATSARTTPSRTTRATLPVRASFPSMP